MGDSIEVRDNGQRAAILRRLEVAHQAVVLDQADGTRAMATVKLVTVGDDLNVHLDLTHEARLAEGFAIIETALLGSAFSIQGRLAAGGLTGAVLVGPRIFSVGRRQHERVSSWEQRPTLTWRHPLDPCYWISAPVLDLSPKGASIHLDPELGLLPASPSGHLLLSVGDLQVSVQAEVRHSEVVGAGGMKVGLRITPQVPSDAAGITRACQAARFPMLVPRAQVVPEAIDHLLRASGYLSLRESSAPAPGWHSLAASEQLTVDLIHRGVTGRPIGHGSYLRIYPNTWLFHQLATIGLRRASVAYPLYAQAAEWALALTERSAFSLSYFDQSKSWHRTMLGEFLTWIGSDSLSTITSLDRLERCLDRGAVQAANPSACVREANLADHAFVAELARSFLPPLVADALYISEPTVHLQDLCGHHGAAGLERSRTALVVEVDGRLEAAALCETGSRTLSLFNILNMAHVFVKRTTAPQLARAVQVSLLRAVLDFYEARGISDPLVVAPHGSVTCPEAVGLTVTESMGCWVASREGLKQWKNYTQFALGPLFHRTQEKRKLARRGNADVEG